MSLPDLSKLRILFYPDARLKTRCTPVVTFDDSLTAIAARMLELMHEVKGVGLAAPQVGLSISIFVCNATGQEGNDLILVNPRFIELTGAEEHEEGCLSIPGVTVTMRRAVRAILEARDIHGRPLELGAENLQARIWQHETDHLEGRLIVDNMNPTDEIANRRALKQLIQDYHEPPRR